jgi:hypothetical protein
VVDGEECEEEGEEEGGPCVVFASVDCSAVAL